MCCIEDVEEVVQQTSHVLVMFADLEVPRENDWRQLPHKVPERSVTLLPNSSTDNQGSHDGVLDAKFRFAEKREYIVDIAARTQ